MTSATLTSNTFDAVTGPIPMGSSTLFGGSSLNRVLTFSSRPDAGGSNPGTNYLFKSNFMIGTFTDRFTPANPDLQYLSRETSGLFVLMEDLPAFPFPNIPSAPLSPAQALARASGGEVKR